MIVKNNKDSVSYIHVNSEWSKMKMYIEQIPGAKESFDKEEGIYVLVLGKKKDSVIRKCPPEFSDTPAKPKVNSSL